MMNNSASKQDAKMKISTVSREERHKAEDEKMIRKRIVIVGAGIVGISTAYYLLSKYTSSDNNGNNNNIDIIIVEWTGTIAPGASGKAAGFLAKNWNNGTPTEEITHASFDLHQQIANQLGSESIQYRRLSCISCSTIRKRKRSRKQQQQQEQSTTPEWFKPKHQDNETVEIVSMGEEDTIAQVHPKLLCTRLWEECQRLTGLSSSLSCILRKGRVVGTTTEENYEEGGAILEDGTIIPADVVVYAAGPWVANIMYGIKGHSVVLQTSKVLSQTVFYYHHKESIDGDTVCEVFVRPDQTAFCTGIPDERCTVLDVIPGQEIVETDKIHNLIQRIHDCTGHDPKNGYDITDNDNKKNKECSDDNNNIFQGILHQRACYQPCTDDYLPVIGPLITKQKLISSRHTRKNNNNQSNNKMIDCYIAGGLNCWGILLGPVSGEIIADLIMTKQTKYNIYPFRPSRFRKLKPVPPIIFDSG